MVNAALLEETLGHIKAYPELHSQSYFYEMTEFGLAACFAARALLLAGYESTLTNRLGSMSSMAIHPETRERVLVFYEAQKVLGLDREWAENLFTPINTRLMLERKVKDLLNGSSLEKYYDLVSHRS